METKLTYLKTDKKEYPAYLSINVMSWIQETYGSFDEWIDKMGNEDGTEPSIKVILESLEAMINEGIDYTDYVDGKDEPHITTKEVGWLVTDMGIDEAAKCLQQMVVNSVGESEEDTSTEKNLKGRGKK